jgi:hypothetical protein
MTHSLPSKKIAVVDVPEVEQFKANFVYNFFTPDERVNDKGTAPDSVLKRPSESFDASFVGSINRATPRYIKFSWKPTFTGQNSHLIDKISIKKNLKKIHNEETFTTDEFTSVIFQDTQLDGKAAFYIQEAIENIEKSRPESEQRSPLDIVKVLNDRTSEEVTGVFLADAFNDMKKMGIRFVDPKVKKEIIQNTLDGLKNVKTKIQLNNKFVKSMLHSVEQDRTGFFADEAAVLIQPATSIQSKAISSNHSGIMKGKDYDLEILDYLSYRKIDTNGFDPVVQVVGYIIEKEEILPNGRMVSKEQIIVENATSSTTIDLKVRYGSTYSYHIKSVAYMEFQAEDHDTNSIIAVSFLACSKPSQVVVVNTVEEIAPPWPADFNVEWDYTQKAARILWSFPVNSQRDIKRFQVFRRSSIYEPFELIRMFDFDDSIIRSPYYEIPEHHLIELLDSPKTYYLDKEFTKDSRYIYTVCSIDAHGFSSNYGPQFEVSFDKFTNKLKKKLISTGGAPKPYPNMYLKEDTFVDTIKDSGHQRLKIYFNPEYLQVVDNKNHDLKLLKTDRTKGKYRFQMINVDLQSQKVVEINLLDKRDSSQKK